MLTCKLLTVFDFLSTLYSVSKKKMQQKYNGMSDVECVTNIDNIGN